MRDSKWLQNQLDFLLKKYFADVVINNPIEIKFGREAKYRFGSIRLEKGIKRRKGIRGIKSYFQLIKSRDTRGTHQSRDTLKTPAKSVITITSMFKTEGIPASVIHHTIAHELCHYAHGFSSTNKRLFKHPHHGGVVNAELKRRGAGELITAFKRWLKEYRAEILASKNR